MKCKVIESDKAGWVNRNVETGRQEADPDTIRALFPSPVDRDFLEDSVCVYEFAL